MPSGGPHSARTSSRPCSNCRERVGALLDLAAAGGEHPRGELTLGAMAMSGYAEVTAALFGQLAKLVKPLSDAEMKSAAAGESKVALLSPGQRIVETSAALTAALKLVEQLSPDELRQIDQRQAKLV